VKKEDTPSEKNLKLNAIICWSFYSDSVPFA